MNQINRIFISLIVFLFAATAGFAQSRAQASDKSKGLAEGISYLSEQISSNLEENRKRRIAVIEFSDLKGNTTDFGRYVSEKLIINLFQTKKYRIVERQLLNKVIAEQKLSLTGIIDPATAQKLGRILGVEAICSGTIADLNKTIEINARLIDTETGDVFSAASADIFKDEAVCNLLGGCDSAKHGGTGVERGRTDGAEKPPQTVVESNFFSFALQQCRRSGSLVSCELTITNKDSMDKKLGFEWDTNGRIYDEEGNRSDMSSWVIAGKSSDNPLLLPDIPVKATLRFSNISSHASVIKRMDLALTTYFSEGGYYRTRDFVVTFQNILLQ
jgi:TolB-like protein